MKLQPVNENKATDEEAKFNPNAKVVRPPPINYEEQIFPEAACNPTEKHLINANKYKELARQHKIAAKKLERFEEEEYTAFAKSTRFKCPLIGNVERVEDIDSGTRLFFYGDSPPIKAITAHIRCHYAFGRKVRCKGMLDRPMYFKDLEIEISGDRSVDITSNDIAVVDKIRKRSRNHVGKQVFYHRFNNRHCLRIFSTIVRQYSHIALRRKTQRLQLITFLRLAYSLHLWS